MSDRELMLANQAVRAEAARKALGVTNASAADKKTTAEARRSERRNR